MALQKLVSGYVVILILTCKGCLSQQPECGIAVFNTRIIGGQNASPGSWPWQANLKLFGYYFCGASLITDQWVLTAAHCVPRYYLNSTEVHLGIQKPSGSNPNEVTRTLQQFVCHPEYNEQTLDNDICLVKLSAPVSFTKYIQPICLASENSTFYDGITTWITGIGLTDSGSVATTLQEVDVPIVGNNRCNCYYEENAEVTENMMCAGLEAGGKDSCQGDSGGPLVVKNGFSWVQGGIVSSGYGCALPMKPGVYTRVSKYQKWISDTVTGMKPGFVTFRSPGIDRDSSFTCSTVNPVTNPTVVFTTNHTTEPSVPPRTTPDDSIFCGGENLNQFTHFMGLSFLALFLHVFVGS